MVLAVLILVVTGIGSMYAKDLMLYFDILLFIFCDSLVGQKVI